MPGASDHTSAAQAFLQFFLQNPTGLDIEAAIYRSPLGTLLRNTLPVGACDTRFCSSSGYLRLSQPAMCCGDHFRRSFRAINRHKGALNESFTTWVALRSPKRADQRAQACRPPFLRTSRLIVEGARFRFCAIERNDCFVTRPREISSRSMRLKAHLDRLRSAGRIPPVRAKCGKIEDDARLK